MHVGYKMRSDPRLHALLRKEALPPRPSDLLLRQRYTGGLAICEFVFPPPPPRNFASMESLALSNG